MTNTLILNLTRKELFKAEEGAQVTPMHIFCKNRKAGGNVMKKLLNLSLIVLFMMMYGFPVYGLSVPPLISHVNDYAEMLSPQVHQDLERRLSEFERSDSTQIVVLTIPTLSGEVLEEFSLKVGNSMRLEQKNIHKGVLLLFAKQERKIRIEVSRGLEGKLTNLVAGQIIREIIAPRCKAGDFGGGISAGITSIIGVTK
jgi:uncharacterized protein